jgi:hypothetical protein
MIGGNADFTAVEVKIAPNAKTAKRFFVQYVPTNPVRAEALRQIAEDAREQRANEQRGSYVFIPDSFGRSFHDCANLVTAETYEVSAHCCTCQDYSYRGSKQNPPVACKHMRMLRAELADLAVAATAQVRAVVREQGFQAREAPHLSDLPSALKRLDPSLSAVRARMADDFGLCDE